MGLLRNIFGPSKDEVWRRLAGEIGGDFLDGGFWRGDKVEARVGEWVITLDTYTSGGTGGKNKTTYTRLRAPFVNADGFRFAVFRAHAFSPLARWMGMQDVAVGDPAFDEGFVVRSDDPDKVCALLADAGIRGIMLAQPRLHLEVKDDEGWFGPHFPQGVDELLFRAVGVIKDAERLKALYELFALVLNRLCHLGSAYADDPGVKL